MHTPEQAKDLWCPMARVAQVGAVETSATYNRVISKMHIPVKLAEVDPETFQLGDEQPKPVAATILKVNHQLSGGAMCVADLCAAWRWGQPPHPQDGIDRSHQPRVGYCGLAGHPAA